MQARNAVLKLIVVLTLITTGTAWAKPAAGQTPGDLVIESTGLFGITRTQTVRLNVTRDDPFFQDDPFFSVELTFVDGDGNILTQKVYELEAGKSAFLELKGSDLPRTDTLRTQMRATVRYIGTPDTRTYMWTPTVEVFDNASGETRFLVPAVQKVQKVRE